MISHATAQFLAALQLDGLPTTTFRIRERAEREGWPWRPRKGSGGGREYCVMSLLKILPPHTSQALLRALIANGVAGGTTAGKVPAPCGVRVDGLTPNGLQKTGSEVMTAGKVPAPFSTPPAAPLADWQRRCADARAAILMEIDRLAGIIGVTSAIELVVELASRGELRPDLQAQVPAANARGGRGGKRTLSRRSIYRWRTDAARGVDALAPASPPPAAIPAWSEALLRLYNSPSQKSLAAVLDDLPAELPGDIPCPSYAAARRFLAKVSIVERERHRSGPNAILKYKAFKRRSTAGLDPLDIVTADGHTFKADVAHPRHGKPFRPEVCALQDVTTRYVFGWSAGLAESAIVVMDAVRSGVEHLGMFGLFYTDNGSGFVGDAMTAEVTGFLARLNATPINSLPGRAQARGKIERLQATLWKRAARNLPTYNGRDMDNEARRKVVKLVTKDIKERGAARLLLSWQEFLDYCRAAVDAYNNRPHRSLPRIRDEATGSLRHMSPAECLADFRARGWQPHTLPAEAAADLWRPYEVRTTARGEVKLPWGRYFSKALEPFGGEQVRVGYDIHDGSRVWVRTLEHGQLICIAERDANVIPEQPRSHVEYARKRRAEGRVKLLQQHAEDALAELRPGLIEYRAEPAFNPALEAMQAQIEAELLNPQPATPAPLDTRRTRFLRALDIEQREAAGLAVSEEDGRWYRSYSATPECRVARGMYEDFGEDALLEA
jgi:putative transposase